MKKLLNLFTLIVFVFIALLTVDLKNVKAKTESPAHVIDLPESDRYNSDTIHNFTDKISILYNDIDNSLSANPEKNS